MTIVHSCNLDFWLESWARWCTSGDTGMRGINYNGTGAGGGSKGEAFDDIELKIEVLVGRMALIDKVAAEALRLDFLSKKNQPERAMLLNCSPATYRRKVKKCRDYILEFINE